VLEYLDGRELDKLLAEGHRFEPDEAASIVWRIADALDHAHQRGVIHRDIKPANIFMQGEQPKLIDFGIARAPNRLVQSKADGDNPTTVFTGEGLLGTPNYMSPEQAQGKPVDARTDIYSLGAVMYEMLTGRKPFSAESADRLVQQIVSKAPPAPHDIDPHIPLALSHIVMKAMSKSPEKRYPSAEKMALDIRRHLLRERRRRRRLHRSIASPLEAGIAASRTDARGGLIWAAVGAGLAAALAFGAWSLLR
ncbi:serine/threonine protein kinase, partial [Oxalobacteraceae bacterium OM1]